MERLTLPHYDGNGHYMKCSEQFGCSGDCGVCDDLDEIISRLAYYEDLEEQGRLIVLPCKVGDKLYIVDGDEGGDWVDEYEVKYFYCSSRGINRIYSTCGTSAKNFRPKDIGKTVFLTYEEAEKALKEDA